MGENGHGRGGPEGPPDCVPCARNVGIYLYDSPENKPLRIASYNRTPLKKVAMPWDVATQVVVLSSPKLSGHVTGHVLMVEGGMEGDLLD
jgi:NAD(P)-dependent dehydrogenase (short-subunit alcohol dehydrogenase family)